MFDFATLTLGVFPGLLFFGAADPVKAPMLAQVVNHARPFLWREQTVEPIDAQLPGRYGRGALIVKKPCVGNQAFALEQACHFGLPPGTAVEAAAHQARGAACKVERFAFLRGFGFVERPHSECHDSVRGENSPADRGDADVETESQIIVAIHASLPYICNYCSFPG